jgi:hypothetical protein
MRVTRRTILGSRCARVRPLVRGIAQYEAAGIHHHSRQRESLAACSASAATRNLSMSQVIQALRVCHHIQVKEKETGCQGGP